MKGFHLSSARNVKSLQVANREDVRRIAAGLPGALQSTEGFGFSVVNKGKAKGFIWAWAERIHPKKARVTNDGVLVVVVGSLSEKEVLLGSDSQKFFTEPHYNGFPAVHVRLEAIDLDELEVLITEAWRCKAPTELVRSFDASL